MDNLKIKLEDVTKIYKTRRQLITAVKNANIEIEDGDFISIIGPSGCGKSTIIRMLNGIVKPTSGKISIENHLIDYRKKFPKSIIKKMGFIFQQPNLLPWLTVRQNVELPLKIIGLDKEYYKNVDKLLEMVNMVNYADAYPIEISGGMVQRVGVIRAMVHDPEILLMDEPFGELDDMSREQLDIELYELWQNTKKTILFITHNVEEAVLLSSRVYVMATNPGRIIANVSIDLPHPRTLQMITQEKFAKYELELTNLIGDIDLSKIK